LIADQKKAERVAKSKAGRAARKAKAQSWKVDKYTISVDADDVWTLKVKGKLFYFTSLYSALQSMLYRGISCLESKSLRESIEAAEERVKAMVEEMRA